MEHLAVWCKDNNLVLNTMLRKAGLPRTLMVSFYRRTAESILSSCIPVWYASCTAAEYKDLQRVVRVAEWITGTVLPDLDSIYISRLRKATSIIRDPTHPGFPLFQWLLLDSKITVGVVCNMAVF